MIRPVYTMESKNYIIINIAVASILKLEYLICIFKFFS